MQDTMHDHLTALKVEKHAVIPAAKSIIVIEARQSLHIAVQPMLKTGSLRNDLTGESLRDTSQISEGEFGVNDLQGSLV